MGKFLVFILGLGVLLGTAYVYVNKSAGTDGTEASRPKRTLDDVRKKAKSIEDDAEKRAADLLKRTE